MTACAICGGVNFLWDICEPGCILCGDCFLDHYVIYNFEFLTYPKRCENCGRELSQFWVEKIKRFVDNYFESEYPMQRISEQ